MSKGELTKERIVAQAASLFNTKGYTGCSMGDLMNATGLKKGGIYNHFATKDDLAVAAFDHAIEQVERALREHLKTATDERQQLLLILDFYRDYHAHPVVAGGCPLLNTMVDSDDGHPLLKTRARDTLDRWLQRLTRIIERGQQAGLFDPTADARQWATVIFATIHGGMALSRYQSQPAMAKLMTHLTHSVRRALQF
ncbi:MAG: TetR/AcrR family transcriptional regulator [Acidobacteria bacterium]|nr:TetR/AcrR family transcriptional regulator [Acidobacteriota bacterium]